MMLNADSSSAAVARVAAGWRASVPGMSFTELTI
jgi:hypothetical protein